MLVGVIAQHATRQERVARRHAVLQRKVAIKYGLAALRRDQANAEPHWTPRQDLLLEARAYQLEARLLSAIIRVEMGIE